MADRATQMNWMGRLVRVIVVFRTFVLLVTIILLPSGQRTAAVGLAVLLAAGLSYLPLRRWDWIASSALHRQAYIAAEMLATMILLAASGARGPFLYFTLGTGAIAGVVYGRRGAVGFSVLMIAVYELVALTGLPHGHSLSDFKSAVFVPLLYPAAIAAGVAAREVIERGVSTEVLLRDRTEALAGERERLRVARELHDSLAKTVEGLALTASALNRRCIRDPAGAASLSEQLTEDARAAALQARALMADLRPRQDVDQPLAQAVDNRVRTFAERAGRRIEFRDELAAGAPAPELSARARHEMLSILGEALINAQRHGAAQRTIVALARDQDSLTLTVTDDGSGLQEPVDIERLKAAGHFGLAGMHERAQAIGARLTVASGSSGGTVVALRVPDGAEQVSPTATGAGQARRWLGVPRVLRRESPGPASARVKA